MSPGWRCKYFHTQKKGGGVARLKEHLAEHGTNGVHCLAVPIEVQDYFHRELDRTKERRRGRVEVRPRREEATRPTMSCNYLTGDDEEDYELEHAMAASRQKAE